MRKIFYVLACCLYTLHLCAVLPESSFMSFDTEEQNAIGAQENMDRLEKDCHGHVRLSLFLRAEGLFGKELSKFWMLVKNTGVGHDQTWEHPAHCGLTASFPCILLDEQYIAALKEAFEELKDTPQNVDIVQLHQTDNLDYIELSSPFLIALASSFLNKIGESDTYLRGVDFPLHISLHKHTGEHSPHLAKIRKLEDEIELDAKVSWVLYLYRSIGDELEVVKKIHL